MVFKLGKSLKKFTGSLVGAAAAPFTGGVSLIAGAGYDYLNYQKEQMKKQNAANKRAIDEANAYDLYTWDLANKYNDPKEQMKRLKAAGLNPNLVYGSSAVTGNTTSVAGSNGAASYGVYNAADDIISKGLPLAQGFANLRNTNNQNKLLEYQMGQTQAQTAMTQAETRNLTNFLDNSGPSTYNPVLEKNGNAVVGFGSKLYNTAKDAVGNFVYKHGDFFERASKLSLNPLTNAWNGAKNIYNGVRSWYNGR